MVELKYHCGSRARVPSAIAGHSVHCLSCEAVLIIPSSQQARTHIKLPSIKRDLATEAHLRALCVNVAGFNAISGIAQVCMLCRPDNPLLGHVIQLALSLALVVTAVRLWGLENQSRKVMSGLLATNTALVGLATLTGQMSLVVGLGCLGLAGALLWLTASRATRRLCSPGYRILIGRSPNQQTPWWTSAEFWAPLLGSATGIAAMGWASFTL